MLLENVVTSTRPGAAAMIAVERRPDRALARGEAGKLGVGAVGEKGQHALFAQPRQPREVGSRARPAGRDRA